MLNDIITEFESSQSRLISILDGFKENNFNVIPFEGSWTAAQVTEHLLKANSGAVHTLKGKTKETVRQPDKNEEIIRSIFLNFDTKMQSLDFILPSVEPKEQEDMITKCIRTGDELRKIVTGEDLTKLCTDFSLPQMGELTRYEWIFFVNCHTRRHTHQLENIFNVVNK